MKSILPVVLKVLVREFYRANAGFFLLVTGLCFGFLRDVEHMALAQFFAASPVLALIPVAVWTVYAIKVILFNTAQARQPLNLFMQETALIRSSPRYVAIATSSALQLAPAFGYGLFLLLVCFQFGQWPSALVLLSAVVLLWVLVAWQVHYQLTHPYTGVKVTRLELWVNKTFQRRQVFYFPEWAARHQPVSLIGVKLFGCALLWSASKLYLGEDYDVRLMGMAASIAFSANSLVLLGLQRFNNFHFQILRNMPFTISQRLLAFAQTLILLLLPEIGVVAGYFPAGLQASAVVSVVLLGFSINVYLFGYMHRKDMKMETLTQMLFFTCIGWLLLILFSVPLLVLAVVNIAAGTWLYYRHFYQFEYSAESDS
ncbi:MAG: hypothetical protein HC859_15360 [Bacteroidia bacterium]|nr:hypothetical protein [Bacteroidia bacterium]